MDNTKNEIVIYQPNEPHRLEDETVWLSQSQMGTLFDCTIRNLQMHFGNIYSFGEFTQDTTKKDFFLVRMEGIREVTNGHDLQM